MKKRLVVANWKMYVESPNAAVALARSVRTKLRTLPNVEVALAPSFVHVPLVAKALERSLVRVGAQAISGNHESAHTGEISAPMLVAAGAQFAIVGHSERRALGESNEMIRAQILAASDANLGVILCVGEKERDHGGEHFSFLKDQLTSALTGLSKKALNKLVIAYEPVWAIGKHANDAMKPQEIQETVIFIKKTITALLEPTLVKKISILYGGSVEEGNAAQIIKEGGVNGFLVGHASAHIEHFLPILKACN